MITLTVFFSPPLLQIQHRTCYFTPVTLGNWIHLVYVYRFLQRNGVVAGISIAAGGFITLLVIAIVLITRRIRRIKVERKMAEAALEQGLASSEEHQPQNINYTSSNVRKSDAPIPIHIQSLQDETDNLVEDFLSSVGHGDVDPPRGPNDEESRVGGDVGGNESRHETPRIHPNHNSQRSSSRSSHAPSRRSSSIFPEDDTGHSDAPMTVAIGARLSSSKNEEYAYNDASSRPIPAPDTVRNVRDSRASEAHTQYPETPMSEYPPSTYPASTLPAYPETIRSVSPPHYNDLSRTQTLMSVRSFRSVYDRSYWSRGDLPSLPSPRAR